MNEKTSRLWAFVIFYVLLIVTGVSSWAVLANVQEFPRWINPPLVALTFVVGLIAWRLRERKERPNTAS